MELAMVNDLMLGINDARISVHDRGLFFGDGVYEAVALCRGRIFALDQHLQRFERSLAELDMLEKVDLSVIRVRINRAVEESQMADALIYFHITRGRAPRSHNYRDDYHPNFLLTVRTPPPLAPEQAAGITHPDWRWKRCDIKSLNLLANVMAKHAAVKAGAYEALLVDEKGLITEATSSSAFMIKDHTLKTAPLTANILPGITRELLFNWAEQLSLSVREESFTPAQALAADELMVVGTTSLVTAITQLDGQSIADGNRGPFTAKLRDRLLQEMRG